MTWIHQIQTQARGNDWPLLLNEIYECALKENRNLKIHDIKNELERLEREGKIVMKVVGGETLCWIKQDLNVNRQNSECNEMEKAKNALRNEIENCNNEIRKLEEDEKKLQQQQGETDSETDLNSYIQMLHRYNELKDAGQILLGKLAELESTTTKDEYQKYDLNLED